MPPIVPSSVPNLSTAVTQAIPDAAAIRLGVVVAHGPVYLRVQVSGADVATDAGWLESYQPVLGDVVVLGKQSAAWVVLGSFASPITANNELTNYSFELGDLGVPPPAWQLVTTSGSPTFVAASWTRSDALDGVQVGAVSSASATTVVTEVVSDPLPVTAGSTWMTAGYYRTSTNFGIGTVCNAQLLLSWYSDATLGSLLSSEASGLYPVTRGMGWQLLRVQGSQGFDAPLDAQWLRARLQFTSWAAAAGDTIYIDRMIARRL